MGNVGNKIWLVDEPNRCKIVDKIKSSFRFFCALDRNFVKVKHACGSVSRKISNKTDR